jgi:hypothetical protein
VLLDVFCYFLDDTPQHWTTLVHVCRKWRRIVFASHQALNLRLFCTYGTPVPKALDCWPAALPIIVEYGGSPGLDPPAPEDEYDIISALKRYARVRSIRLTVTSSLLEKIPTISDPFLELEELALLSQDNVQMTLPCTFRWGPRLRTLRLTRIAFPSLPLLISSCHGLVDLQLHEIPLAGYFSPEAFANALTGLTQLQSLSLHFFSHPLLNETDFPPQTGEHILLPALIRLRYLGTSEYLDSLVARIHAPHLGDIEIVFVNTPISDLSQLREFIGHIEMHKSHRRARITSSERTISISLIQPGASTSLKVHLFCERVTVQLDSMSRLCTYFASFLLHVEDLYIDVNQKLRWDDHLHTSEALDSFIGVKWFHVSGDSSIGIVRALDLPSRRCETVLPALHKLYICLPGPRPAPLMEAIASLMTSRQLSDHPIAVEYQQLRNEGELRGAGTIDPQYLHNMSTARSRLE